MKKLIISMFLIMTILLSTTILATEDINNSPEIQLPKEVIISAIESLGKGASVRGEALTLEEFAKLSNAIINLT